MQRGFTLIDLMIIIAVVAIIASIAIPGFENTRRDENTIKCLDQQDGLSRWIADFVTDKQNDLGVQRERIRTAIEDYINDQLAESPGFTPVGGELQAPGTVPNTEMLIEAGFSSSIFINIYAEEGSLPGTGFNYAVNKKIIEGETVYEVRVNSSANYRIGPSGGLLSSDDTHPNAGELIALGASREIFVCPERADTDEPLGFHYVLKGVTGNVECTTDVKGDHRDPNARYVHTLD